VFRSWNGKRAVDYRNAAKIPHDLGTAVNLCTMVFGNLGNDSATGVAMTRSGAPGGRLRSTSSRSPLAWSKIIPFRAREARTRSAPGRRSGPQVVGRPAGLGSHCRSWARLRSWQQRPVVDGLEFVVVDQLPQREARRIPEVERAARHRPRLQAAQARGTDVLIADTAGRLHTQSNLMAELKKVRRVLTRLDPTAPHEVLLVLDGSQGQNALAQAQQFQQAVGVTGLVMTKLDGTAKGGIVLAIADTLKLPIRYIGIGETAADFDVFDAGAFVDAVLSPARSGPGA